MNARGAGSCDQAVRPRHVRRVGGGDEEQKAEERVGEHDVEMQGGPEEEIIEMGEMTTKRTSRRITRWPEAPVGDGGERALLQRTYAVQELVSPLCTGINEREIKKDWGFLSTTWSIASLAMSLTG